MKTDLLLTFVIFQAGVGMRMKKKQKRQPYWFAPVQQKILASKIVWFSLNFCTCELYFWECSEQRSIIVGVAWMWHVLHAHTYHSMGSTWVHRMCRIKMEIEYEADSCIRGYVPYIQKTVEFLRTSSRKSAVYQRSKQHQGFICSRCCERKWHDCWSRTTKNFHSVLPF